MSNRNKILKFCKDRKIEVVSLTWNRNGEYIYGDYGDTSYWLLEINHNGELHSFDTEDDTVELGINRMFQKIDELLNENLIDCNKHIVDNTGHGNCPDCEWYKQPEGCATDRDSKQCKLNYRKRIDS